MNLEGDTLLQIKKWWDSIIYTFSQSFSTNKSWAEYKYITADQHQLYYFILPLDTYHKLSKAKENYEELSRSL